MSEYFSGIKVGDRVWSVVYGWGEVATICPTSNCGDAARVRYEKGGGFGDFLMSGVDYNNGDQLQTLFWSEVTIIPPPKPKRMVRKEVSE